MSPNLILVCVIFYTAMLFFIVWLTSKNANNETYYIGNRSSPWYVVAYGMIGASLSGVTFLSVPGWVGATQFSYMMVVFGYLLGYATIAGILLPLYYRMNLTSIYSFLETRFGFWSHKTGAFYFLLSRTIGASFRLFIVVNVLQLFVFDAWGIPFWVTTATFIIIILLYTFKGGVKTIVWTDTLQTTFMLLAVLFSIILIARQLNFGFGELFDRIFSSEYSNLWHTDWRERSYFLKHFFGGMFIAIAMTGLDQDMMQKNISVKTLPASQKNMITFSLVLVFVNLMFMCLGVLLFLFMNEKGIPFEGRTTDDIFPTIALNYLGVFSAVFFVIGLISATYSSADGSLTALTSIFCIDFLGLKKREDISEQKKIRIRYGVHLSFAALLLFVIVLFRIINDDAVIGTLFTVASYTYGPLLGLYAFGLFSRRPVRDKWVPVVAILSPAICYLFNNNSVAMLDGYKFGFELLIVNGALTYLGLWIASGRKG